MGGFAAEVRWQERENVLIVRGKDIVSAYTYDPHPQARTTTLGQSFSAPLFFAFPMRTGPGDRRGRERRLNPMPWRALCVLEHLLAMPGTREMKERCKKGETDPCDTQH